MYAKVAGLLATNIRSIHHDMELFRRIYLPPERWELRLEVDSLAQALDDAGASTVDLVGYSGGAAVSLAFSATHPERIRTLALIEPPWIGNDDWGAEERSYCAAFDAAIALPDSEVIPVFQALMLAPDTPPPVARPMTKEIEIKNVTALRTVWAGYRRAHLDRETLRRVAAPILLLVGSRSRDRFLAAAKVLAAAFPRARVNVQDECHHHDLLQVGASTVAASLDRLWAEAEST